MRCYPEEHVPQGRASLAVYREARGGLQRRRRGYVTLSPRFGPDSHITGTGDLYNRRKRKDGGHGDQKSEGKVCTPNMAEVVAEEIQVSPRTVKNAGEFAQVLEVIREDDDDEPLFFREEGRRPQRRRSSLNATS